VSISALIYWTTSLPEIYSLNLHIPCNLEPASVPSLSYAKLWVSRCRTEQVIQTCVNWPMKSWSSANASVDNRESFRSRIFIDQCLRWHGVCSSSPDQIRRQEHILARLHRWRNRLVNLINSTRRRRLKDARAGALLTGTSDVRCTLLMAAANGRFHTEL
jgi:hypothetical protein